MEILQTAAYFFKKQKKITVLLCSVYMNKKININPIVSFEIVLRVIIMTTNLNQTN